MLLFIAALRRLRSKKMARTTRLMTVQAPIVPPMIAPRFGFEGPETGVRVGESDGVASTVTVAVRYNSGAIELAIWPGDLMAVLVNPLGAQPC
jgi:hypothetical protein